MQNSISGLQNAVSELQNAISGLQNTVSELQNTVSEIQNTVSEIQNTMVTRDEFNESMAQMRDELREEFHESISVLRKETNARFDSLEKKIDKNSGDIMKLQKNVIDLRDDFDTVYILEKDTRRHLKLS